MDGMTINHIVSIDHGSYDFPMILQLIFPSAGRDGLGMGGLCPVESHTTPGGGELKGKSSKPNFQ